MSQTELIFTFFFQPYDFYGVDVLSTQLSRSSIDLLLKPTRQKLNRKEEKAKTASFRS